MDEKTKAAWEKIEADNAIYKFGLYAMEGIKLASALGGIVVFLAVGRLLVNGYRGEFDLNVIWVIIGGALAMLLHAKLEQILDRAEGPID